VKIKVTLHKMGSRYSGGKKLLRFIKRGQLSHQRKFMVIFNMLMQKIVFRSHYVLLSFSIESHMSTNISASDNHKDMYNLNCITAGVGKFVIEF